MILKDSKLIAEYDIVMDFYNKDNIQLSVELFEQLANKGVPEACQMLSFIYRVDDPFKDSLQSSQWNDKYLFFLKKYSDEGNLEATLELGRAYQYGSCIGINNKKAVALITKAAEGGLDEAQFHLQGLYRYGWAGLPKNYEKMTCWLDKACAQEHLEALYQKGLDLLTFDSNSSEGMNYINRSAELGFWVAKEYLDSFKIGK